MAPFAPNWVGGATGCAGVAAADAAIAAVVLVPPDAPLAKRAELERVTGWGK